MFYRRIIALVAALVLSVPPLPAVQAVEPTGPTVIINELMWMGSSVSSFDEWLELRNLTDQPIELSGWYLSRFSSGAEQLMLTIPSGLTIQPHGYFVISNYGSASTSSALAIEPQRVDTAISLANTQLQIKLYQPDGTVVDVADDASGKPLTGAYVSDVQWASMERNYSVADGTVASSWHSATSAVGFKTATEFGTPGSANSNSAPVADAGEDLSVTVNDITSFDATNSTDPDGDQLTYAWDFGDGGLANGPTPTHVFGVTGSFITVLTVSDGALSGTDSVVVTVTPKPAPVLSQETKPLYDPNQQHPIDGAVNPDAAVRLSEILPNPVGLDKEGEFIELHNQEKTAATLTGWRVVIGTKSYTLPNVVLPADEYLALRYQTTKLTLNNDSATVELRNPNAKIIDSAKYEKGEEGNSFVRVDGRWQWTDEPTPGEENVIVHTAVLGESKEAESEGLVAVTISDISGLDLRTKVETNGIVSVVPDVFGSQYFYIFDGTAGIKVYSTKKAFPKLSVGDAVTVTGAVGESEGERKINITSAENVRISGHGHGLNPLALAVGEVDADLVGSLIVVSGRTDTVTKTQFVLADGGQSIGVAIKKGTGIGTPSFSNGTAVTVTGVVTIKADAVVLLPRSADDLVTEKSVLGETATLADTTISETTALEPNPGPLNKSLLFVLPLLILGGVGYWYWRRKQSSKVTPSTGL